MFANVGSYHYWSSSTVANNTGAAWVIRLVTGYVSIYGKTNDDLVLPVRGGQSTFTLPLAKTEIFWVQFEK